MARSLCAMVLLGTSFVLAACLDDKSLSSGGGVPHLLNVTASVNVYNSLSTVTTFEAANIDSARIVYQGPGESAQATPFHSIAGPMTSIVTLGLVPNTAYTEYVEAFSGATRLTSDTFRITTSGLPPLLRTVAFSVSGTPPAGYTVFPVIGDSTTSFIVAFDSAGRITWYRAFDEGLLSGETKQLPNGDFTVFVGNSFGYQPTYGTYREIAPTGGLVRVYAAPPPYYTDSHELLLTFRDSSVDAVHTFGYDLRRTDLSPIGGASDVLLAGHTILRQTTDGQVQFFWSGWDHFVLEDWIEPPVSSKQMSNIDLDHPNSLAFDLDGNYIASWRNLGEVTKIDYRSGRVMWRLGGRNNQFTILNDPLGGFSGEHCVRVLGNGHLLLYDNGLRHLPPESRAAEYEVDTIAKTATLVWQFRNNPPLFTPFLGSVTRRANGNTIIGFGGVGLVTEVTPQGAVVWEGQLLVGGQSRSFYRALTIQSLYRYQLP